MNSNVRRASSSCVGSNSQSRSRPTLTSRTRPAAASTPRCFVTAWRDISVPDVSCVIDMALPTHRAATSLSRISSPKAANTGAQFCNGLSLAAAALRFGDMLLDVLHLLIPPRAVHAQHVCAARQRYLIQTGFNHGEQRAAIDLLQLEHDQGRRFLRIVNLGIDGRRVPAPGKQLLRHNSFDEHIHIQMLVARISDLSLNVLSRLESLAFEIDAKPVAELSGVGHCAPHTGFGSLDQYLSFNAICRCVHMQPPGCILDQHWDIRNHLAARSCRSILPYWALLDGAASGRVTLCRMNPQPTQHDI